MRDLRKQALESHKTVSRKARSKPASAITSQQASPAISHNSSRVASRDNSDDETVLSDSTTFSAEYLDDDFYSPADEEEAPGSGWVQTLEDQITLINDKKRSSVQGREDTLEIFNRILSLRYVEERISRSLPQLLPSLIKSAKSGASEKEIMLSLRALALIAITAQSDNLYDPAANTLTSLIQDSESGNVKAAAIHAQATLAVCGGASDDEFETIMSQLLEIIESDGATISADDDADVVTAAAEEWCFLATQLEDVEHLSEEAAEILNEQLDSTKPSVQINCGEGLVLLMEKSLVEPDVEDSEAAKFGEAKPVRGYDFYSREHQVKQKMAELSRASPKWLSRQDRKALHYSFSDMLDTLEHETGPRQRALAEDGTTSRPMTVRIGAASELTIDTWEHYIRLKALRRLLQSGLQVHYADNPAVFDMIPLQVSSTSGQRGGRKSGKPRASGRMAKMQGDDDDDYGDV